MTSDDAVFFPAGSAAADGYDVEITPETAGWTYSGLRVVTLRPGDARRIETAAEEMFVVPLQGGATLDCDGERIDLQGRANVFAGASDVCYVPIETGFELSSIEGGRFALAGARTREHKPLRYIALEDVAVELRGAGQCSREVRNFGTADAFDAGAAIACEVVTPGGNWSSYPAHKHDEQTETESELEEIYYFEIAAGPNGQPGFGFHRTSSSAAGEIELLAQVHDGDVALVPYGWHGPCTAAPGHDMYYLNVMAGPGERAWRISDHPEQTWIRDVWAQQSIDPRLIHEG